MPIDTRYTDEQVATWIAEKYPMRGHRTGEMLRALLAEVRAARLIRDRKGEPADTEYRPGGRPETWIAIPVHPKRLETYDAARAATDALLGAEVQ